MRLRSQIEERLVFDDRTTNRTTKLVPDQVILHSRVTGKPIICCELLNTVVLEKRAVPLVGTAFQHSIGHEPTRFSILRVEIMSYYAIFLNGIRRNRGVCPALTALRSAQRSTTLPLLIVVDAFHHEIAGTSTRSIHGCTAERKTGQLFRHGTRNQIDEIVRVARFERHVFPDAAIDQLRQRRILSLDKLLAGFHRYLLGRRSYFELYVPGGDRTHADHDVLNLRLLETLGRDFQRVGANDRQRREVVGSCGRGHCGAHFACRAVAQLNLNARNYGAS